MSRKDARSQALVVRSQLPTIGGKWFKSFSYRDSGPLATPRPDAPAEVIKDSGHTTVIMIKSRKGKPWLYKQYKAPWLAQAEAVWTAGYRRIDPTCVPKCRVVYTRAPLKCAGAMVKLFDNFLDLHDFLRSGSNGEQALSDDQYAFLQIKHGFDIDALKAKSELEQKLEFLVYSGFTEALISRYYFQDDDSHKGNLALVAEMVTESGRSYTKYRVVNIDFDRSGYSLWKSGRAYHLRAGTVLAKPPSECFPISGRDIDCFPDVVDHDPWYWPTIYRTIVADHGYSREEVKAFKSLKAHPEVIRRKFERLLRIAITPDESFKEDIDRHTYDATLRRTLFAKFKERKAQLRAGLLSSQSFGQWWYDLEAEEGYRHRSNPIITSLFDNIRKDNELLQESTNRLQCKKLYWQLACDIARPLFDQGITDLQRLIESCGEETPRGAALKAFQRVYNEKYVEFTRESSVFVGSISDFIEITNNTLAAIAGICAKPISSGAATVSAADRARKIGSALTDTQDIHFANVQKHLSRAVHQLRQYRHVRVLATAVAAGPEYGLQSVILARPAEPGLAEEATYDVMSGMVTTAEQRTRALITQTLEWLLSDDNIVQMQQDFRHAKNEFADYVRSSRPGSWMDRGTWCRRSLVDINRDYANFCAATTTEARLAVLKKVFSEKAWDPQSFNMRFLIKLLSRVHREIIAKNVVEQMRMGGAIITELQDIYTPSLATNPIIGRAFFDGLSAKHEVLVMPKRLAITDHPHAFFAADKHDVPTGAGGCAVADSNVEEAEASAHYYDDAAWEVVEMDAAQRPLSVPGGK